MRRHTRQADTAQMLLNVIHLIVGEVVSLTWRSQQHIRLRQNKQVNNHPNDSHQIDVDYCRSSGTLHPTTMIGMPQFSSSTPGGSSSYSTFDHHKQSINIDISTDASIGIYLYS